MSTTKRGTEKTHTSDVRPPHHLRCEYLEEPLCLDTLEPRFGWWFDPADAGGESARSTGGAAGAAGVDQAAYRIVVSSSYEDAAAGKGDLWDSGWVESSTSGPVAYAGKPLASCSAYWWGVRCRDAGGRESACSAPARFETGPSEQDWRAQWITAADVSRYKIAPAAPDAFLARDAKKPPSTWYRGIYLRREFTLSGRPDRARLYVSGLGYYTVWINGRRIGDRALDPAQTDYRKIALFSAYDVDDALSPAGEPNVVGVLLGNGRHVEAYGYGAPKMILQLGVSYPDGGKEIICSDGSWKTSQGALRENGIYYGATVDAREEAEGWDRPGFDDSAWRPAAQVEADKPAPQMMQPVRATAALNARRVSSPRPGRYVFDFGQNFSGVTRLHVQGPKGTEVKVRHAELLDRGGMLKTSTNRSAEATDTYILKGGGPECFEPSFTYHGFRYAEVSGYPGVPRKSSLEGLFVHSDVPRTGEFACSNELLNRIHQNIVWGQLSNLVSVPTDCPQRDERQGWMGDAQLSAEEAVYNFDMAQFYRKYLTDIRASQKEDGSISDVVPPYWPLYPADPAWGSAYVTLAWILYWYYGDLRVLEEHYENIRRYVDFLSASAEGNIQRKTGKFGDWCPPGNIQSLSAPLELVATWYHCNDTLLLSRIAQALGKDKDHALLFERAEEIKGSFNREFLHDGEYGRAARTRYGHIPDQTSNVLPLYHDMPPEDQREAVVEKLIKSVDFHWDFHPGTGIVGTRYLLDVLDKLERSDAAYRIASRESYPSWGYMVRGGATTLWERWEKLEGGGMNSHNHIMLGSVDAWFYKTLAGIQCTAPAWEAARIKPYLPEDMGYAGARVETVKGPIESSWERRGGAVLQTVAVPCGCRAEVWVPTGSEGDAIEVNGRTALRSGRAAAGSAHFLFRERRGELHGSYAVFSAAPGRYQIRVGDKEAAT